MAAKRTNWVFLVGLSLAIFSGGYADVLDSYDRFGGGAAAEIAGFLVANLVTVWLVTDVQRRGRCLPYDTDTAVAGAWFLIAPVYFLWTRRFRGVLILLGIVVCGVIVYAAGMFLAELLCSLSRS